MVDGSPLEALRQKTEALRQRAGVVLGGKMLGMVAAFSHRPLWQLYTEDAAANDKRLAAELLAMLPPGGLVVCALGFFSFLWCDACTAAHKCFGTRMREKTAYRTVRELSSGPYDRDESMEVGQYHSHPCRAPLRRVSVL
jgi:hypothetical protein